MSGYIAPQNSPKKIKKKIKEKLVKLKNGKIMSNIGVKIIPIKRVSII